MVELLSLIVEKSFESLTRETVELEKLNSDAADLFSIVSSVPDDFSSTGNQLLTGRNAKAESELLPNIELVRRVKQHPGTRDVLSEGLDLAISTSDWNGQPGHQSNRCSGSNVDHFSDSLVQAAGVINRHDSIDACSDKCSCFINPITGGQDYQTREPTRASRGSNCLNEQFIGLIPQR